MADPNPQLLAKHIFPIADTSALAHWEHHRINGTHVFYHYHPQFELNLMETDRARRIVGDTEREIRQRELILLSPNLPHRWQINDASADPRSQGYAGVGGSAEIAGHAEFWVLAFSRISLGQDAVASTEYLPLLDLLSRCEHGLAFSDQTCGEVAPRLKAYGEAEGLERARLLLEIFESICSDTHSAPLTSATYHLSAAEAEHRIVDRVVRHYMHHDRLLDQITPSLPEASAIAQMTVASFTRMFRRATGDSLVSYITRLRIARACSLLESTDLQVAAIAAECGFANLSHFNRQFKRRTGMQPREYRRTHDRY